MEYDKTEAIFTEIPRKSFISSVISQFDRDWVSASRGAGSLIYGEK